MKKIVIVLILALAGLTSNAQTFWYQAHEFAYKIKNNDKWTGWSDWRPSSIKIMIDVDSDIIKIFSDINQTYNVVQHVEDYTDDSGGQQAKFRVVDQDGDRGTIRLRVEKNNNSQLYVEYADVMFVYSGLEKL